MNASKFTWPALCCAALVGACGGGSDNSAGASATGTQLAAATTAAASSDGLATSVPPATYPSGSGASLAFERLNRNRGQCGFGLLAQNAQIDQAAAAHASYVLSTQQLGHYETAGTPGFTGTGPKARAAAAGYDGGVGEILAGMLLVPSIFPRGDVITEMLMDVPYHAVVALQGMRDVGIAYTGGVIVIDPAHRSDVPLQSAPGVRTYPCEGSTEVRAFVGGEEPSPFPADPPSTQWGPTISVVGHALRVSAAAITGPNGSMAIKAILGDGATKDPNGFCTGPNACVVPQPLEPGVSYRVHLEGTDGGVPFTKDFSFSTAAH